MADNSFGSDVVVTRNSGGVLEGHGPMMDLPSNVKVHNKIPRNSTPLKQLYKQISKDKGLSLLAVYETYETQGEDLVYDSLDEAMNALETMLYVGKDDIIVFPGGFISEGTYSLKKEDKIISNVEGVAKGRKGLILMGMNYDKYLSVYVFRNGEYLFDFGQCAFSSSCIPNKRRMKERRTLKFKNNHIGLVSCGEIYFKEFRAQFGRHDIVIDMAHYSVTRHWNLMKRLKDHSNKFAVFTQHKMDLKNMPNYATKDFEKELKFEKLNIVARRYIID